MKKSLFAAATCVALIGCSADMQRVAREGVRSGAALEQLAQSSPGLVKTRVVTVPRSQSAVTASLTRLAANCMNFATQRTVRGMGGTGIGPIPMAKTYSSQYTGRMTKDGGVTRLEVRRADTGSTIHVMEGTKGFNVVTAARIGRAPEGGTAVKIVGTWGFDPLSTAIERWAKGDELTCPNVSI